MRRSRGRSREERAFQACSLEGFFNVLRTRGRSKDTYSVLKSAREDRGKNHSEHRVEKRRHVAAAQSSHIQPMAQGPTFNASTHLHVRMSANVPRLFRDCQLERV